MSMVRRKAELMELFAQGWVLVNHRWIPGTDMWFVEPVPEGSADRREVSRNLVNLLRVREKFVRTVYEIQ